MCITKDGDVIQEMTRKAMNLDDAPSAPPPPAEPAPEPPAGAEPEVVEAETVNDALVSEEPPVDIVADLGDEPETDEVDPVGEAEARTDKQG
jgi:hypothetical protein